MELLAYLDARQPEPETELIATNARLMAQTQIEKIRQYQFFTQAMDISAQAA